MGLLGILASLLLLVWLAFRGWSVLVLAPAAALVAAAFGGEPLLARGRSVQPPTPARTAPIRRCRGERIHAAGAQRREPCRFRRGSCGLTGLCGGARLGRRNRR